MAEVKYGQPCPSTSPDGAACAWFRSHKNDHRDAASNGRCWTGGIRTVSRWRCPRGGEYAPCGTCPTCLAKENAAVSPKRIQLRRTKGWRKPEGVIVVARPSKWGNPFRVQEYEDQYGWYVTDGGALISIGGEGYFPTYDEARADAVREFRHWLNLGMDYPDPTELAGHDLACWCPLDRPCHADVLLEIANGATR